MTKKITKQKKIHFEQATVFPREPKSTVKEMIERGFNPVI